MFGLTKKPESRLWEALLANRADDVRQLLQEDGQLAEVRAPQRLCRREPELAHQSTPLHAAAARGYDQIVKLLLLSEADLDAATEDGSTPLHEAAMCGHADVVELLLYRGASPNARNKRKQTPLHCAAWAGHDDVVKLLLDHGAASDVSDDQGNSVLHALAAGGCEAGAKRVLESGVDINLCNQDKERTPLHLAIMHADHSAYSRVEPGRRSARARMERMAQLLIDHGADVNALDAGGNTPLDTFNYLQGDDESDPLVKLLLRAGGHWVRYNHRHSEQVTQAAATQAQQAPPAAGESHGPGRGAEETMAQRSNQASGMHATAAGDPFQQPTGERHYVDDPIPLGSEPCIIGRNADCDIRYRSRTLSRKHAQVTPEHGEYVIKDLGSHNGVVINGHLIHAPHVLTPGETITLGVYEFEFDGHRLIPLREELTEAELRAEGR